MGVISKVMKKYYLKTTKNYFYDPHGTADFGGTFKEVVDDNNAEGVTINGTYINACDYSSYLDRKGYYEDKFEDDEENDDEQKLLYEFYLEPSDWEEVVEPCGMDGYNYEVANYTFKEISEEEYYRYKEIINNYNKL